MNLPAMLFLNVGQKEIIYGPKIPDIFLMIE